ncbi:hypothetical protein V5799_020337 [Amblyomma americanum]|uniref:Uncharacterized protein n=1 Tax=Amblyomma americanum TaxID=6943 RepID=A0AAQ4EUG9_AMBAM
MIPRSGLHAHGAVGTEHQHRQLGPQPPPPARCPGKVGLYQTFAPFDLGHAVHSVYTTRENNEQSPIILD